jgi:hypothetical protein
VEAKIAAFSQTLVRDSATATLSTRRFETAWQEGTAMDRHAAVASALEMARSIDR